MVWNPSPFEDITFTFTRVGGTPVFGQVAYVDADRYHAAGVSDGSTLSLYLANATQVDMTASGSTNTALTAGNWTVGRNMYNGDRGYGFIDEVRISDAAVAPANFLFAVPEPATGLMLSLGWMATAIRCRR